MGLGDKMVPTGDYTPTIPEQVLFIVAFVVGMVVLGWRAARGKR